MKSEEDIWVPPNKINISCLEVFQDVCLGVTKKHGVRICNRIVLEVTVFHKLNIHFFQRYIVVLLTHFPKFFPC
jgi:hypothetical protein